MGSKEKLFVCEIWAIKANTLQERRQNRWGVKKRNHQHSWCCPRTQAKTTAYPSVLCYSPIDQLAFLHAPQNIIEGNSFPIQTKQSFHVHKIQQPIQLKSLSYSPSWISNFLFSPFGSLFSELSLSFHLQRETLIFTTQNEINNQ